MLGRELQRGTGVSFNVVDTHLPLALGVPGFASHLGSGAQEASYALAGALQCLANSPFLSFCT
jgi:hypothetical protein